MITQKSNHTGHSEKENNQGDPNRDSNTRLVLTRRFDWVTWCGKGVLWQVIERLITKYFKDDYIKKDYAEGTYRGDKAFDHEYRSANGAVLMVRKISQGKEYKAIDVVLEEPLYEIILSLSGRPLAIFYKDNNLIDFIKDSIELTEMGLHPSRLDLKYIDYAKVMDFKLLEEAGLKGNYRGVKKHQPDVRTKLEKISKYNKRLVAKEVGNTQYFGSRQSNSYYRFYKEIYCHYRDSFAYENELKGSKAKMAILFFISKYIMAKDNLKLDEEKINDELINLFNNMFINGIDFIDRNYQNPCNGSLKECPRLDFWQKVLNHLNINYKLSLTATKPKPTLKTTWNWLGRQVSNTINILKKGAEQIGFDYKLLIEYLSFLADQKLPYKPKVIQKDIAIKINQIANEGLDAIMAEEEATEFIAFCQAYG